MKKFLNLSIFLLVLDASAALAMPKTVILIRHAEKPVDKDDIHLSEKGYARAKALPGFFTKFSKGGMIRLFAQGQKRADSSLRPIETLLPSSKKFGQEINHQFVKDDSPAMVEFLKSSSTFNGKTVVISWGHDEIGMISQKLGKDNGEWSSAQFDRAWVYQFNSVGKLMKFSNLPQKLLPGDSQEYTK
jgi:hypothetical protein